VVPCVPQLRDASRCCSSLVGTFLFVFVVVALAGGMGSSCAGQRYLQRRIGLVFSVL
jgi:FlaG/FlaF family flagellin (archaellin)